MKKLLFTLTILCLVAVSANAQTAPTFTTTTMAIAGNTTGNINVTLTSTSGITVTSQGNRGYLLIDSELFRVIDIPASGTATLTRAQENTFQTPHASGAYAVFGFFAGTQWQPRVTGSPTFGVFLGGGTNPVGGCTLASQQFSPNYQLNPPSISGGPVTVVTNICDGGVWVKGVLADGRLQRPASLVGPCSAAIGSVAYGSMGTSTTTSATAEYHASVNVPTTIVATGITQLNGSAVDTASKKIVILYDSSGKLIAYSALAGTAATGNDAFQAIAFTTPVVLPGPAKYFIGLQDDTADVNGIRTIAASTFNNVVTSSTTSVFGTVASVTAPTTFTADVGPIGCIY